MSGHSSRARRLGSLAVVLSRYALWRLAARFDQDPAATGPRDLRRLVRGLGGTYIKFGQILALQPDLLPLPYCDALLELLDRVEPVPFEDIRRVLEEELGKPTQDLFEELSPEPLATASIGQVHIGVVHGTKVAVKVQRPRAPQEFEQDIQLMETCIRWIRILRLRPLAWLIEPTSEFVRWTREELDFRFEARYARALFEQARSNEAQGVPRVLESFTSRRTLITTFLDGIPLLAYLRAREQGDEVTLARVSELGFDEDRFAANVIENFLGDVFRHGIYHADLHPANLLILRDNRVGYVDFGIIGVLSPYSRRHLVTMTLAMARGDISTLAGEYLRVTEHGPGSDYEGLREGLERLAGSWYVEESGGRRLHANFTVVMGQMLRLSRQTRIMPERDIVKYIRSAIAIDGLITRFAPEFDLGAHLAGSCARLILGQAFTNKLTSLRLTDLWNAGNRLLGDGSRRALEGLDALLSGPAPSGGGP